MWLGVSPHDLNQKGMVNNPEKDTELVVQVPSLVIVRKGYVGCKPQPGGGLFVLES